MTRLLENLIKLVETERRGEQEYRSSFTEGIRTNQTLLAEKLLNPDLAPSVLHLLRFSFFIFFFF